MYHLVEKIQEIAARPYGRLNYCPQCGTKVVKVNINSSVTPALCCGRCDIALSGRTFIHFAMAIVAKGTYFLLRERADGTWALPDSGTQQGRPFLQAIRDQIGFECTIERILGLYDLGSDGVQFSFYVSTLSNGILPRKGGSNLRFFGRDEIPWEHLANEATRDALVKAIGHGIIRRFR